MALKFILKTFISKGIRQRQKERGKEEKIFIPQTPVPSLPVLPELNVTLLDPSLIGELPGVKPYLGL